MVEVALCAFNAARENVDYRGDCTLNISDWLRRAGTALTESGCPDPDIDARWMAEDVLHLTRTEMKFEGEREVRPEELQTLNAMLSRRAAGEPVQYILERANFMGPGGSSVDHRVLIPCRTPRPWWRRRSSTSGVRALPRCWTCVPAPAMWG